MYHYVCITMYLSLCMYHYVSLSPLFCRGVCRVETTRPLIELALREKNELVARYETKRLVYKLKVLGQPVTSGVRSSAERSRKAVIADNFASDRARAKFRRPACFSRRVDTLRWFFIALG